MSNVKMWQSLHISPPSGIAAIRQIPLKEEKNKNNTTKFYMQRQRQKNYIIQANTQNATRG